MQFYLRIDDATPLSSNFTSNFHYDNNKFFLQKYAQPFNFCTSIAHTPVTTT